MADADIIPPLADGTTVDKQCLVEKMMTTKTTAVADGLRASDWLLLASLVLFEDMLWGCVGGPFQAPRDGPDTSPSAGHAFINDSCNTSAR